MGRKRIGVVLAYFMVAGAFFGCSQEGNLVVKNECATEFDGYVDGRFVELQPGDEVTLDIGIGRKAVVIGPNELEVEISGYAMTKKMFTERVIVEHDATATFAVADDVSALIFWNASNSPINEIKVHGPIACETCKIDSCDAPCDAPCDAMSVSLPRQMLLSGASTLIQLGTGCWRIDLKYGAYDTPDSLFVPIDELGKLIDIPWVPGYVYEPDTEE